MVLIIGTTLILPVSIYALCKTEIKLDSKITINKDKLICIEYNDKEDNQMKTEYLSYNPGERLIDTLNNHQNELIIVTNSLSCNEANSVMGGIIITNEKTGLSLYMGPNNSMEEQALSTDEGCYKIMPLCIELL